jgi:hypothetical protein
LNLTQVGVIFRWKLVHRVLAFQPAFSAFASLQRTTMKSFLMVLGNLEAFLICAMLNHLLTSCGLYGVTLLSYAFLLQSALSALAALVFWFSRNNRETALLFTLLNAISVAGCLAGVMPFRMGCAA